MIIKDIPHKEKRDDEMFMGNTTSHNFYKKCGLKHKRLGCIAYEINGKIIDQRDLWDEDHILFPCFVKKAELIAAGFTIED